MTFARHGCPRGPTAPSPWRSPPPRPCDGHPGRPRGADGRRLGTGWCRPALEAQSCSTRSHVGTSPRSAQAGLPGAEQTSCPGARGRDVHTQAQGRAGGFP